MGQTKRTVEKERYCRKTIREAARSRVSIREFCRERKLNESQFYRWQRRLKQAQGPGAKKETGASFALVTDEAGAMEAGIELVLNDGRRLRIARGVDPETLRAVLAVVESAGC